MRLGLRSRRTSVFTFARFLPAPVVIGVPDLLLPGDVEPPPEAFERLAVVSDGDFALL